MRKKIAKVRGMRDIFFDDADFYRNIVSLITLVVKEEGYQEMIIPTMEQKKLFEVKQEGNEYYQFSLNGLYTFEDKKGRKLILRPEGTLPILRCCVENKLVTTEILNKSLRVYYHGKMFRYERPQLGRYREFTQFGIEFIGEDSVIADLEVIILLWKVMNKLNYDWKGKFFLKIGFLGSLETKSHYVNYISSEFSRNKWVTLMCDRCEKRQNALRILECIKCSVVIKKNFHDIRSFWTEKEKRRWAVIESVLKKKEVNYQSDFYMVRGLAYYTGVIFEVVHSEDGLELAGGGRYDGLVNLLNSSAKVVPSIGWSIGIDRLILKIGDKVKKKLLPQISDIFLCVKVTESDVHYEEVVFFVLTMVNRLRHDFNLVVEYKELGSEFKYKSFADQTRFVFFLKVKKEEIEWEIYPTLLRHDMEPIFSAITTAHEIVNQIRGDKDDEGWRIQE